MGGKPALLIFRRTFFGSHNQKDKFCLLIQKKSVKILKDFHFKTQMSRKLALETFDFERFKDFF